MEAVIFILILSVLVILHELGHFLAARRNGVEVKEFGLGYPPRIATLFTWKKTIFSLNAIPFGGFVQMEGEDGPESTDEKTHEPGTSSFYQKSKRARLEVLLAGVFFNLVFGVLALAVVFSQLGIPTPLENQVRIAEVSAQSPAAQAGLQGNTAIVALQVDSTWIEVRTIGQVQELVAANLGKTIGIRTTLACQDESCPSEFSEHSVYLRSAGEIPEGEGSMGVVFTEILFKRYPWYLMPWKTVVEAFKQSMTLAVLIVQALGQLAVDVVTGRGITQEIAGPIGIVDQATTYGFFDGGWLSVLNFAALLSINLAVMNLLPIPALDGGRAVLVIMEKFVRRSKLDSVAYYLNYFGYMSLLALMVLVSFNDIMNLFK